MKFSVEIGSKEKHQIDFSFNQIFGGLVIRADGQVVRRDFRGLSFSTVKAYEFQLGCDEKLVVRIEKERRLVFGYLFPQKYRVFVNGDLITSKHGY
jgi:hypothetical protein